MIEKLPEIIRPTDHIFDKHGISFDLGRTSLAKDIASHQTNEAFEEMVTGQQDFSEYMPEDYEKIFIDLFTDPARAKEITIFREGNKKIFEAEDTGRTFIRVLAEDLYDLVDENGDHFVDDIYRNEAFGGMLDFVRRTFPHIEIQPFDLEDEEYVNAYVGNGMFKPDHQFPKHEDTDGTISVLMFVSDITEMNDGSGDFYVTFGNRKYYQVVVPQAGWGYAFIGEDIHSGIPLNDNSETKPRLAIAFSYKDPKRYKGKSEKFKMHRKSGRAEKNEPELTKNNLPLAA